MIRLGTAGWSVPSRFAERFPEAGSALERYAARFCATEINSSFHRPHRPQTYARWAASVPDGFRFAVKLPKTITHAHKLVGTDGLLDRFLGETAMLGDKLGPLLIQLPPSLAFDAAIAAAFLGETRSRFGGPLACEPRHPSWFEPEAQHVLVEHRVARVEADPARFPEAGRPGGWPGLVYIRLHGSPRMYYSAYDEAYLAALASRLTTAAGAGTETWCMFDNTASGAATGDALVVAESIDRAILQPA